MAAESVFTLTFKTVAQLAGIEQLLGSVQAGVQKIVALNTELKATASNVNATLSAVGLGLGLRQLDEYGKKALEVREQQAAFTLQIIAGRDGNAELVSDLNALNQELEKTTGTTASTSRSIEQLLSRAGATGDQIKQLTHGIIEFAASSAGTVQPLELASVLARRLSGAADASDISLTRLGLHAKDTSGLIAELKTRGGQAGEAIVAASGGMKQFEMEVHQAELAIGNFVNLIRLPFLAGFTEGLAGAKQNIDDIGRSFGSTGEKIWVTIAVISDAVSGAFGRATLIYQQTAAQAKALVGSLALFADGIIRTVVDAVTRFDTAVINGLANVAKYVADTARTISLGTVNIDTGGIDRFADSAKGKINDLSDWLKGKVSAMSDDDRKITEDAIKEVDRVTKEMQERGPPSFDPERLAKIREQYRNYINSLAKAGDGVKPGSGVIDFASEADKSAAAKAATDALTEAKYRLSAAEQNYKTQIDEVKLLEDSGAISSQRADELRAQAIRSYIAQLQQLQATLPTLIAQMQALGNVKGVAELKLEFQEITNKILESKIALQGTSFFGKILQQTRQLQNEWGDLAKQIGGFLTQQFQNFASGASQAITGLIFRTQNWRQAVVQLAQSFVQSLIQMVIQTILARTVLAALNRVLGQADEQASQKAASQAAAQWAPAAISASIASYGVAAGVGLAAWLAAVGVGTFGGAAVAGVGGGGGGFELGGWTGGREGEFAGFVHGQEVVFPAPRVRELGREWLVNLAIGSIERPSYQQGGFVGNYSPAAGESFRPQIHVFNFTDPDALRKAVLQSTAGQKIIVDTVRGRRLDLGIG